MALYFKIVEINQDEFFKATSELFNCNDGSILSIPTSEGVFVGVDEEQEHYFSINLDCFSTYNWCGGTNDMWRELYKDNANKE